MASSSNGENEIVRRYQLDGAAQYPEANCEKRSADGKVTDFSFATNQPYSQQPVTNGAEEQQQGHNDFQIHRCDRVRI